MRRFISSSNYLYQVSEGILLEETIKMVVLSPLLEIAGFYQAPYRFRAEVPVAIEALGDQDEILRGRIDALVLQDRLWIVLIESKRTTFDLELALPQALAYMAANPQPKQALYGMVTNGSTYLFMKTLVSSTEFPIYFQRVQLCCLEEDRNIATRSAKS